MYEHNVDKDIKINTTTVIPTLDISEKKMYLFIIYVHLILFFNHIYNFLIS